MSYPSRPLSVRFWEKVIKSDGCWTWSGNLDRMGYGVIRDANEPGGHYCAKNIKAHRVSWKLHYGPIPDGLLVLHRCDNRPCIRPDHLFLGTYQDNRIDCEKKGRAFHPRGSSHPWTKLTDDQVSEIRRLRGDGIRLADIASRFDISQSMVSLIARDKARKTGIHRSRTDGDQ